MRWFAAIQERWRGETDGAGLAGLRMLAALSVLLEMLSVWFNDGVAELIVDPQIHFKYPLFEWIGPPQGMMPQVFVWTLAALAGMVLVGWRTRWTASLMAAGYVYWFLIDAANYSDHGYLVCLLSLLTAWLPTNRWAAVDAYMGREQRTLVPSWTVELVRTQIALIYFCFGCSLLNGDWLSGAPLIAWIETTNDAPATSVLKGHPGLALLLARLWPVIYLAWGSCLWWKRTRLFALIAITLFHAWDQFALQIGVSPWLLTGLNLIFCDSRRWRNWGAASAAWLSRWPVSRFAWKWLCRLGMLVDASVRWFDDTPLIGEANASVAEVVRLRKTQPQGGRILTNPATSPITASSPETFPATARWGVAAWMVLQCWLPIRFVTVESNPDWTDMATTFAWRGRHRDKQCELKMSVIQPSQELRWPLDPTDEFPVPLAIFHTESQLEKLGLSEGMLKDLVSGAEATRADRIAALKLPDAEVQRIFSNHQASVQLRLAPHQYEQFVQRPELIRQYAHRIGAVLSRLLKEEVQVHAGLQVKLNNRPSQLMLSDHEEMNLLDLHTANELADKLPALRTPLPTVPEQIASAKDWAARRREELEQQYDIVPEKDRRPGEPVKLPGLSDEDERWYQKKFAKRK